MSLNDIVTLHDLTTINDLVTLNHLVSLDENCDRRCDGAADGLVGDHLRGDGGGKGKPHYPDLKRQLSQSRRLIHQKVSRRLDFVVFIAPSYPASVL
jgi:hypothetical protein